MEVHSTNAQLEPTETREINRTVEVEPQIIPAIVEESPAQIEEDKPVLEALQVRQLPPSSLPTNH